MISSVPSRRCEIASERIASSVTTPPALRITCASPSLKSQRPVHVEAGVHARHDRRFGSRRQREVALVERGHVVRVVREQVVGQAHFSPRGVGALGVGAGGNGPIKLSKADRVLGIFMTSRACPAPAPHRRRVHNSPKPDLAPRPAHISATPALISPWSGEGTGFGESRTARGPAGPDQSPKPPSQPQGRPPSAPGPRAGATVRPRFRPRNHAAACISQQGSPTRSATPT